MVPMVLVKTKRLQVGVHRRVEHVPQPLDVGAEQRRRVAQPRPGVDDAVEDVVAVGHRRAHRRVVEDVAVVVFDVEVLDRFRRAGPAQQHSDVVAAFDQLPGDMGAEEPARTDHQLLRARHGVKCSGRLKGRDRMSEAQPQRPAPGASAHRLRRMSGRDPHEQHRVATPLELLFDLTFVIAFGIAANEFAHLLAENHVGAGLLGFSFATFAVCWAWINFSWFASAYDTDDWIYRLMTMLQMVGVLIMALGFPPMFASIEHGEHVDNRVMVAGYVVMRIALVGQWLRAAKQDPERRSACLTYATVVTVAQVGWIGSIFLHTSIPVTFVMVALLIGIELLGPWLAETRRGGTPWHAHHIAERYGLLAIIALGEGVVGTVASLSAVVSAQGWIIRRHVRRGGRHRADLRHVVDVFRGAAGRPAARPPRAVVRVRLLPHRDVRRHRGDRRGPARRRVLHRAPFRARLGRDGVGGGGARGRLHRRRSTSSTCFWCGRWTFPPAAAGADRWRCWSSRCWLAAAGISMANCLLVVTLAPMVTVDRLRGAGAPACGGGHRQKSGRNG